MKHLRLVFGIIGVAIAAIAAMAQAPAAPAANAPQAQTPTAPVPNGPAAPGAGAGQGRGGGQQAPVPGAPPVAAIDSPLLRNYSTVTKQRLLKPEDRNWLMIRRTYDGWGYSPLDKITPANVSRLKLVWSNKTLEPGSH